MISAGLRWGAVLACALAIAIFVPAVLASASAQQAQTAAAPCTTPHTAVWFGDGEGGGTAGRTYYPIEFSNVGHASCTLYGYPGVSPQDTNGRQVGRPAGHSREAHSTVTIPAGGTAHAILAIDDWGAICSKAINAAGLKIYPPGQTQPQAVVFPLTVCANKSVLVTGPVRAGVGVPGYTSS
jgi:hypothetical protein